MDAGCSCPNRDGTKGSGGCIFCSQSGSGDFVAGRNLSINQQVETAKELVQSKLHGRSGERHGKYIAYFQNFTSTYGDAKLLLEKYHEALECSDVVGLALATRPDCLNEEILQGLAEISHEHFVQIELGLQTSNEQTGLFINRCYTNDDYIDALRRIRKAAPNIHIVTHLIFGLPGETQEDMLNSVKFVVTQNHHASTVVECLQSGRIETTCHADKWGIKITSLYVLKNTRLADIYKAGNYQPLTKELYFDLLKKALPLLPANCVVHRLTGDPPKSLLLAPSWPTDKKRVLNEIKKLLF